MNSPEIMLTVQPGMQVIKVYEVGTWFTPCIFDDEQCHLSLIQAKQNGTIDLSRLAGYHRYQGTWKPCMGECFKDKDHRTKGEQKALQGNVGESIYSPSTPEQPSSPTEQTESIDASSPSEAPSEEPWASNESSGSESSSSSGDETSGAGDGDNNVDNNGGDIDERSTSSSGSRHPAWRLGKKLQAENEQSEAASSLLKHFKVLRPRRKAGS